MAGWVTLEECQLQAQMRKPTETDICALLLFAVPFSFFYIKLFDCPVIGAKLLAFSLLDTRGFRINAPTACDYLSV